MKISEALDSASRTFGFVIRADGEHPAFEAARCKAQRLCDAGLLDGASRVLMDALEREDRAEQERRENHRRLRLRFLEEAVVYDMRALRADLALGKIRQISEITNPNNRKAQTQYVFSRASEYQRVGMIKGDNAALHMAVLAFSWLAKEAIDGE